MVAAASPRRSLTPEEKRERDNTYRIDVKQFGDLLKYYVQIFNSLTALNTALGQAGKGKYLTFPDGKGNFFTFNRKHLRSANAQFAKSILILKNYLRVSKKKNRDQVKPESFSGTYTPVYAGDALRQFFTMDINRFGFIDPATKQEGSLMAALPYVQAGYLLRNTNTMLFYIYAHANELQDKENAQYVRSDDIMTTSFGGQIPAAFYSIKVGKKTSKTPMDQAVAGGIGPFNTYDVIRSSPGYAYFNPAEFNTYFFQNIAAANYYSKGDLTNVPGFQVDQNTQLALQQAADLIANPNTPPQELERAREVQRVVVDQQQAYLQRTAILQQAAAQLADPTTRQHMLEEHNLVKLVSKQWHDILEPNRKIQRDARKKIADAKKKADKAAAAAAAALQV